MVRFLDVVFDVTMEYSGMMERVEISFAVSSRFNRAFTTRALTTCCSVNAVLMYLMS